MFKETRMFFPNKEDVETVVTSVENEDTMLGSVIFEDISMREHGG